MSAIRDRARGSSAAVVRRPAGSTSAASHVAAAELVERVEQERAEAAKAIALGEAPTFRRVAGEWLAWRRDVKGGAPSTLRDNEALLREPGAPYARGSGESKGRIMKRFGDELIEAITTRDVSAFLRELDGEDIGPKTVNKHRELLHTIFNYAMRSDTYGDRVKRNPVTETDKRRQPPAAPLDHYERHEIEALVRVCEQGRHRAPRHYKGRPVTESADELAAQAAEDRQDAAAFALMFYSGLRLGELLALRWRRIRFLPDLSGAIITVERAVSADVEKAPKSGKPRDVPVARPAAEALARLGQRDEFTVARRLRVLQPLRPPPRWLSAAPPLQARRRGRRPASHAPPRPPTRGRFGPRPQQHRPHHDPRLLRPREPLDHEPLPALEARRHRRRGNERRARDRVVAFHAALFV